MANTPLGYPYPLGTDRVMDGDDVIHSLASAVDSKLGVMACGVTSVNITTAGTPGTTAVTFPAGRFTAAPVVVANIQTSAPQSFQGSVAAGTTATGCTITASRVSATGAVNVSWIAVQNT